jgi:hypothetical protein
VAGLGFTAHQRGNPAHIAAQAAHAWADVPVRSGMPAHLPQFEEPAIGHLICSPASVLEAMQAFGAPGGTWPVSEAARRVLDHQAGIYGNWTRAAQLAHEGGLRLKLCYGAGLGDLFAWLSAGALVVCSIRYAEGELTGAPRPQSKGHLCLVSGYDATARMVLCHDTAAPREMPAPHRYRLHEFAQVWLGTSALAYVIEGRAASSSSIAP